MDLLSTQITSRPLDAGVRKPAAASNDATSRGTQAGSFAVALADQQGASQEPVATEPSTSALPVLDDALQAAPAQDDSVDPGDVILVPMGWAPAPQAGAPLSVDLGLATQPVEARAVQAEAPSEPAVPTTDAPALGPAVPQTQSGTATKQPAGAATQAGSKQTETAPSAQAETAPTAEQVAAEVEALLQGLTAVDGAPETVQANPAGRIEAKPATKSTSTTQATASAQDQGAAPTEFRLDVPAAGDTASTEGDTNANGDGTNGAVALEAEALASKTPLDKEARSFDPAAATLRATQAVDSSPTVTATHATSTPLGAQDLARSEAVLGQVHAKIQPGMQRANLRLNPEELGRVSIELSVDQGEVRAEMRVESKEALQILQRHIPELRAMFAQADLDLAELNFQLQDSPGGFAWHGEEPGQQSHQPKRGSQKPSTPSIQSAPKSDWTQLSFTSEGLDLLA